MVRFLAGVASALLLCAAGFLLWTSRAERESVIPEAKPARLAGTAAPIASIEPPAAPEEVREKRRFARYDGNEDGSITRAEMLETRRKPFQKLDVNNDGRLSFEEWAIATAERFDTADRDRSGTLTAAEFATTRRETKPKKCDC
jgi:Ca2+-binding EF-hand superfamily protein